MFAELFESGGSKPTEADLIPWMSFELYVDDERPAEYLKFDCSTSGATHNQRQGVTDVHVEDNSQPLNISSEILHQQIRCKFTVKPTLEESKRTSTSFDPRNMHYGFLTFGHSTVTSRKPEEDGTLDFAKPVQFESGKGAYVPGSGSGTGTGTGTGTSTTTGKPSYDGSNSRPIVIGVVVLLVLLACLVAYLVVLKPAESEQVYVVG